MGRRTAKTSAAYFQCLALQNARKGPMLTSYLYSRRPGSLSRNHVTHRSVRPEAARAEKDWARSNELEKKRALSNICDGMLGWGAGGPVLSTFVLVGSLLPELKANKGMDGTRAWHKINE
jgi:hypothetical protein